MRQAINPQMKIGEVGISDIRIDLSSRDEIPQLLLGFQAIYCNRTVRDKVFEILTSIIPKSVGFDRGRKGMNLWTILVLGTLRLNCNWDYDKLWEIANNHKTVRQMIGHDVLDDRFLKDQFGFVLHHHVMERETDDKVAAPMVEEALKRFPALAACSFDKGFHSPANQERLAELLKRVVPPGKGKLSAENREIENAEEFRKSRRMHSAVESSIHALKNHGVDRRPDRGIHGFKRYVALAVVARNIQILGAIVQKRELKKARREQLPKAA